MSPQAPHATASTRASQDASGAPLAHCYVVASPAAPSERASMNLPRKVAAPPAASRDAASASAPRPGGVPGVAEHDASASHDASEPSLASAPHDASGSPLASHDASEPAPAPGASALTDARRDASGSPLASLDASEPAPAPGASALSNAPCDASASPLPPRAPASRDASDAPVAPHDASVIPSAASGDTSSPTASSSRTGVLDFEALFAPGGATVSVGAVVEASGRGFGAADVRPSGLGSGVVPPAARRAIDAGRASTPKPRPTPTPASSRPAPTADPALRERPGPVLPGWIGVVAGGIALAGCAAVLWWAGAVPDAVERMLRVPMRPYHGIHLGQWALLTLGVILALFSLGGLGRGRVGYAWVLTLFGEYRGSVRRTGLLWVSPLLLRRRVDVRLRHWRSEPLPSVDAKGTALNVVVLVVWRIRDTVRAALGVEHHEEYLREQVEAAMARVLSQLPADAFHEDAPTLRDAEAVGEALTKMLSAECAPVGIDVFSAQPTRIEYAPEIAAAMRRRRIAAIDAKHRDSVLTSVVDAVDDMVHRLTTRGLVELDDYERKALVKDLTVAFYTGRSSGGEGA
ncbi:SPFH domain-containing protein [Streptomyces sp.]|uniref:SPFH domain-containing protein n=1 Tax=Streptomyces sp. TaxID=1931 RepID=UPI0039C92C39